MPRVPGKGALLGGRYRLMRPLGEGGMGVVWAARDTESEDAVAVKVLRGDQLDRSARRRCLREAGAARSIEHPGVVRILDVLDDGYLAIVMELCEGEPLDDRILREGGLTLAEAGPILLDVCAAVGAGHANGVVHRDVKPENVFLCRDGSVKVLDFGIAKMLDLDATTASSLGTSSGTLVGTPTFMAPEQIFRETEVDHRADVWSFGVLAYQTLTGIVPTSGNDLASVLKTVLTGAIVPIEERAPDLPVELARMIGRMLSVDREQRPGSMVDVAEVIAVAIGRPMPVIDPPITRRPRSEPQAAPVAPKRPRAERKRWALFVAAVAVTMVGVVAYLAGR